MYEHDDPNNIPHQPALDSPSSDRPPQFNWRNCGYDCGEGCEKASEDDGGGGVSDDETAVDTDEERYLMTTAQEEGTRVFQDVDDAATESSGLDQTDYAAMSDSMVVEPCVTTDHSPAASAGGSARSRSPDPGVLYWVTHSMPVATPLPIEYFFLQTPLRLSPQYEHCRGDPASHLVLPDRSPLWYLMEQSWNGYGPAYGYISPP
jgi:hypothetical protein